MQILHNNNKLIGKRVKKKALVLAVGLAFATPTISVAKALPSNLIGSSLGEIQSKSYLNEPFKGVIPILFTNIEASKKLKVKLAPESVFQKIGAEKLPILDNLKFQVEIKNNKPVIQIISTQPIQMPFLNFVLEIVGPHGSIYQDYTTLLDPKGTTLDSFATKLQAVKQQDNNLISANSSSHAASHANRTHTVKSGDTLSEIAQALNAADVSLKKMVAAIHQKNPNAFANNNVNKLKAGAVLHIPTKNELSGSSFKTAAKVALENKPSSFAKVETGSNDANALIYTIKKGDNLSRLTKKLGHKEVSFTKMMKAIHTANPHAFSKNKINLLKVGKILTIPTLEEVAASGLASQKSQQAKIDPNLITINDSEIAKTESSKEFVLDGFIIEKGDTLAKVAKQIGHKGIPHSQMMRAIYVANPDAFEKNNITMLIEGALIRLPSIAEIKKIDSANGIAKPSESKNNTKEPIKQKPVEPIKSEQKNSNQQESNNTASDKLVLNKLEKRVRELKRDLNKAHSNLSTLELSLVGKESLLKKQSSDLAKLASTLQLLDADSVNKNTLEIGQKEIVSDKSDDESQQVILTDSFTLDDTTLESISPGDPIEFKGSAITTPQSGNIPSETLAATKNGYIPKEINQELTLKVKNKLVEYSQYMSGKELFASILALLFGLLLVRYRREIYAYTNISYDYPKYYPPFGEEEARALLKEKSINYHDTLIHTEDESRKIHQESNSEFSNELLKECEDLADELIDDLEIKTSVHSDNDEENWNELDKACNDYIAEYKDNNIVEMTDAHDNIIEGAESQTEEMTFELFEALAAGVATNEKPKTSPFEDDTLIYGLDNNQTTPQNIIEDNHLIPFDELATISKKTDKERKVTV